jgi:cation:H+ antiporter
VRRDGVFMLAASAAAAGIAIHLGVFSAMTGWLMLAGLAVYLAVAFLDERRVGSAAAELHADCAEARAQAEMGLGLALGLSIGGVALLVLGADLLVRGAVDLARLAGLSETVIGLTIVALGTSLPELVASLAAALRGRSDIAFGNIVGSNIYNTLGIIGITAVIQPIQAPVDFGIVDWGVMVAGALLLVVHASTGAKVSRSEGALMMAVFLGYLAYLIARATGYI